MPEFLKFTPKRAIWIAMAISIVCLVLYVRSKASPTQTIAITPLDRFAFEHGYVWGLTGRPVPHGANLWMLYPGAEPKSKKNQSEFKKPGRVGGRLVTFLIEPKREAVHGVHSAIEADARKAGTVTRSGNLELLGMKGDREYFKISATADPFPYINCSFEGISVVYPSCRKYASLSDRLTIYFIFSRERLAEWESIQSELIALIESKRIKN